MPLFGHKHEELHEVRAVAQEDVDSLGTDIEALAPKISSAPYEVKERFDAATKAHQRAQHSLKRAKHPEHLAAISQVLEVGRFQLTAGEALLHGKPVPDRRPPCFFDPRHGPSTESVKWTPAGGEERLVPVCAACAELIKAQSEPPARKVQRRVHNDDQWMYWWDTPGFYGPWAGGYYQSFGGGNLINDLIGGSILGGAIGLGGDVLGAAGNVVDSGIGAIGGVVDGGLDAIGDVADGAVDAVDGAIDDLFGDGDGGGDGGGGDGGGGDGGGGDGGGGDF